MPTKDLDVADKVSSRVKLQEDIDLIQGGEWFWWCDISKICEGAIFISSYCSVFLVIWPELISLSNLADS